MINEKDLNNYLEAWVAHRFPRYLGNRFFQGTLVSVISVGGYWACTLQRTGETITDGAVYPCFTPGYVPVVGQVVQCMWLDASLGIVLFALARASAAASLFRTAAFTQGGAGWAIMPLDTVEFDPAGLFSVDRLKVTVGGFYQISGQVLIGSVQTTSACGISINGALPSYQGQINVNPAAAGNVGLTTARLVKLAAGNTVALAQYQAVPVATPVNLADRNYLTLALVG